MSRVVLGVPRGFGCTKSRKRVVLGGLFVSCPVGFPQGMFSMAGEEERQARSRMETAIGDVVSFFWWFFSSQ